MVCNNVTKNDFNAKIYSVNNKKKFNVKLEIRTSQNIVFFYKRSDNKLIVIINKQH